MKRQAKKQSEKGDAVLQNPRTFLGVERMSVSSLSEAARWFDAEALITRLKVEKYVPTRIDVTPNGGGKRDERAVMESTVEADRCSAMDRRYAKFRLFNKQVFGRRNRSETARHRVHSWRASKRRRKLLSHNLFDALGGREFRPFGNNPA